MGLFSFLHKKDPYEVALDNFLRTREAAILYSNLKFYMGYDSADMNNPRIERRVKESFGKLTAFGLSYSLGDELAKSMAAIEISKELMAIGACDSKLASEFEYDFFRLFGIQGPHKFGRGELFD